MTMNKDALSKAEWNLICLLRKYPLLDTAGRLCFCVYRAGTEIQGEPGITLLTTSETGDREVGRAIKQLYIEQSKTTY